MLGAGSPDDTHHQALSCDSDLGPSLSHVPRAQNPRERITLQEVMKHPWATMDGRFPLKSTRELRPNESQELHDQLPGGQTFAQCHPRPDYLNGLAMLSRHERTFAEGDCIMRQGDTGAWSSAVCGGPGSLNSMGSGVWHDCWGTAHVLDGEHQHVGTEDGHGPAALSSLMCGDEEAAGPGGCSLHPLGLLLTLPLAAALPAGTYLMYIVSGTVDVLVKWTQPPRRGANTSAGSAAQGGAGGPGSAAQGGGASGAGGPAGARSNQDEFMDDSDSMSPITDEEGFHHRVNLARAAGKARDFVQSLQSAAGGCRLAGCVYAGRAGVMCGMCGVGADACASLQPPPITTT